MTQSLAIVPAETGGYHASQELALPGEEYMAAQMHAILAFQRAVRQHMNQGSDYGVIPGTGDKPTLLKPGAEKLIKLLNLREQYEIADSVEDWDKPFFRYLIKCQLVSIQTGVTVAESFGECNSYESKYRWRWVFPDDVPASTDRNTLTKRTLNSRRTGKPFTQFRMPNDDIHTQVNTLLKMAQKRALVSAALSVGRLSEVFTADLDDIAPTDATSQDDTAASPPVRQNTARPPVRSIAPVPAAGAGAPVHPPIEGEVMSPVMQHVTLTQELEAWIVRHFPGARENVFNRVKANWGEWDELTPDMQRTALDEMEDRRKQALARKRAEPRDMPPDEEVSGS